MLVGVSAAAAEPGMPSAACWQRLYSLRAKELLFPALPSPGRHFSSLCAGRTQVGAKKRGRGGDAVEQLKRKLASRCLTKLLSAALCNAHKLFSLTSLPIKWAGFMHFHDFWGTCENQSMFIGDSEDKPNYTPDSRSICFLVFCALPSRFRKPGQRTARTASLDLDAGTILHVPAAPGPGHSPA